MKKVSIHGNEGLELEISPGSHVFYKREDGNEVYFDWQEIVGQHPELKEVFSESVQSLERLKSIVPVK
jgi:hypothetical protein